MHDRTGFHLEIAPTRPTAEGLRFAGRPRENTVRPAIGTADTIRPAVLDEPGLRGRIVGKEIHKVFETQPDPASKLTVIVGSPPTRHPRRFPFIPGNNPGSVAQEPGNGSEPIVDQIAVGIQAPEHPAAVQAVEDDVRKPTQGADGVLNVVKTADVVAKLCHFP